MQSYLLYYGAQRVWSNFDTQKLNYNYFKITQYREASLKERAQVTIWNLYRLAAIPRNTIFNIKKLYVLPTHDIYVCHDIL